MKRDRKEPLYRKVNTRARRVWHWHGGDYRHERNTKREQSSLVKRGSMGGKVKRGLDYTPLYRFLLSKVGKDWDAVHSEAISRLDKHDPIFHMVALREEDKRPRICIDESTFFSGLYVDDNNVLQIVDPTLGPESMKPFCPCCTHTFNGVPFTQKHEHNR